MIKPSLGGDLPPVEYTELQQAQDVLTALKRALSYISLPEHWTQDVGARDKDGRVTETMSEHAVSYCSVGALKRAMFELRDEKAETKVQYVKGHYVVKGLHWQVLNLALSVLNDQFPPHLRPLTVDQWNDAEERTHAEVVDTFRRAIEAQESVVRGLQAEESTGLTGPTGEGTKEDEA